METKEKIMLSAFNLFSKKGYAEVSVNNIIEKAGITKGGFYHYFNSKEELFYEVMDSHLFSYIENLGNMLKEEKGPVKERLRMLFESAMTFEDKLKNNQHEEFDISALYICLIEGLKEDGKLKEKFRGIYSQFRNTIAGIIEEGRKDGSILKEIDPESMAFHIVAAQEGAFLMWVLDPEKVNLKQMIENMFKHIWKSLENK